jgi:hypothetical protein
MGGSRFLIFSFAKHNATCKGKDRWICSKKISADACKSCSVVRGNCQSGDEGCKLAAWSVKNANFFRGATRAVQAGDGASISMATPCPCASRLICKDGGVHH